MARTIHRDDVNVSSRWCKVEGTADVLGDYIHGDEAVALGGMRDGAYLGGYAHCNVLSFKGIGTGLYQQQLACGHTLEGCARLLAPHDKEHAVPLFPATEENGFSSAIMKIRLPRQVP